MKEFISLLRVSMFVVLATSCRTANLSNSQLNGVVHSGSIGAFDISESALKKVKIDVRVKDLNDLNAKLVIEKTRSSAEDALRGSVQYRNSENNVFTRPNSPVFSKFEMWTSDLSKANYIVRLNRIWIFRDATMPDVQSNPDACMLEVGIQVFKRVSQNEILVGEYSSDEYVIRYSEFEKSWEDRKFPCYNLNFVIDTLFTGGRGYNPISEAISRIDSK